MPRKQRQSQYSLTGHTYSTEDIERIKKQPGVVDVTPDMITFDLNFKQGLYDDWIKSPCVDTLRRSFQERGFDLEAISERVLFSFNSHFRIHGRPTREAYRMFDKHDGKGIPHKTKDDLVAEGVLRRVSNGHRITPEYMALIKGAYDKSNGEKSIEDVIRESGYNPSDIGDFRLSYLHKVLEDIRTVESRNSKRKIKTKDDTNREVIRVSEGPEKQEKLKTAMAQNLERQKCVEPVTSTGRAAEDKQPDAVQNQPRRISTPTMWTKRMVEETPYVHVPMQDCVQLTEAFFNDAIIFQGLPLNDILAIYGIPKGTVPREMHGMLENTLRDWEPTMEAVPFDLNVAVNRFVAMRRLLDTRLAEIKEELPQMTPPEKKKLCEVIDAIPRDNTGEYSNYAIRDKIGISQTLYYKYLRNERYGMRKSEKKLDDVEAVRKVFEYKGFKKGSRQIYMLMPKIVGRKMGLKKIRRIMRENGMESDIRTPNAQKRAMEKYLKENRKPNLLDRRFRLYRPNQVRLTDVTYIDYGPKGTEKKRAYGSASIDPVTGKLIAFVVMETNDQKLADATLREMDNYPCEFGGKFHSDQGSLYLMPDFQAKVMERGFDQSMSRRGNCWDNSPQESFFGHFKDECDYESCESLDELHDLIEGYKYYYNYERGMWDRLQMTPVAYEEYMSSLSEEEFQKYLDEEEARYREMQAHSIERAKKRIKDLGAEDMLVAGGNTDDTQQEGGGDDE